MLLQLAVKNILAKLRKTIISLAGVSISVALLVAVALILKSAQQGLKKPLEAAGADLIIQQQGEPCFWSTVKLPTNLNPIPKENVDKLRALPEVMQVQGALITWAFSNSPQIDSSLPHQPGEGAHNMQAEQIMSKVESGELKGQPCDYGPKGSFCATGGEGGPTGDFRPVVMVGVSIIPDDIGPLKKSDIKRINGEYFSKNSKFEAILDKEYLANLRLKVGDTATLGARAFKIIGAVESGPEAKIAGAQVYIPLETAIELAGRGDIVDIIFVKLKGSAALAEAKKKIQALLGSGANITVANDYLAALAGLSGVSQGLSLAILAVIILIVTLFLIKTSSAAVLERAQEFGILKAIGWKRGLILRLLFTEQLLIGIAGGIMGCLLGFAASLIYKLNLPAMLPYALNPYPPCSQHLMKNALDTSISFSPLVLILAMGFAVAIELIAGMLTAKKITSLSPAEAMRKL